MTAGGRGDIVINTYDDYMTSNPHLYTESVRPGCEKILERNFQMFNRSIFSWLLCSTIDYTIVIVISVRFYPNNTAKNET